MRDYIHVDDVVSALICVSEHGVSGEIYNVGSFDAVTVRNVVKYIMKIRGLDYDSLIDESIEKLQGISLSFLNNIKLKNLGWKCGNSEHMNYKIRMI
jgi:nucleoside-diphosphate-sugar epimerase